MLHLKKILVQFICAVCFFLSAKSQSTFQKIFSTGTIAEGHDVIQTADGNFVACGGFTDVTGEIFVVKFDQSGDTIWTKIISNSASNYAIGLEEMYDRSILVFGSINSGIAGVVLLKLDSTGNVLMNRILDFSSGTCFGMDFCKTFDSGFAIFITHDQEGVVIRLDANADTLWTRKYIYSPFHLNGYYGSISQTLDSGFIFVTPQFDIVVRSAFTKIDKSGNLQWFKQFVLPGTNNYSYISCLPTLDGGYLATGQFCNAIDCAKLSLLKLDANGDTVWSKRCNSTGSYAGSSIIELPDSSFILSGLNLNAAAQFGGWFLSKFDKNGNSLWNRYTKYVNTDYSYVKQTSDNGFIQVGEVEITLGNPMMCVLKTDSNGFGHCNQFNETLTTHYNPVSYYDLPASQQYDVITITDVPPNISSGCGVIDVCTVLNTNEIDYANNSSIYPDPFSHSFHLVVSGSPEFVELYDISGRLVFSEELSEENTNITPSIKSGIYVCRIKMKGGSELVKKIVAQGE